MTTRLKVHIFWKFLFLLSKTMSFWFLFIRSKLEIKISNFSFYSQNRDINFKFLFLPSISLFGLSLMPAPLESLGLDGRSTMTPRNWITPQQIAKSSFLDAIASSSCYPCEWVSEWVSQWVSESVGDNFRFAINISNFRLSYSPNLLTY